LPVDIAVAPARDLLRGWDGHARRESAAALLFERWLSEHVQPGMLERLAPQPDLRAHLAPGDIPTIVRLLQGRHPDLARRAGLLGDSARDGFLADTLLAAWEDTCARYGSDPAEWRWDALHQGYFNHAIADHAVGPHPTGGSNTTVMMAHYETPDYRVRVGASVRMVVDVGGWDNSVWINAPGQSGVPGSPHYDDLAPIWAAGDYVPMLYSAQAVDAATARRLLLIPKAV
jgi:penicillin amidase